MENQNEFYITAKGWRYNKLTLWAKDQPLLFAHYQLVNWWRPSYRILIYNDETKKHLSGKVEPIGKEEFSFDVYDGNSNRIGKIIKDVNGDFENSLLGNSIRWNIFNSKDVCIVRINRESGLSKIPKSWGIFKTAVSDLVIAKSIINVMNKPVGCISRDNNKDYRWGRFRIELSPDCFNEVDRFLMFSALFIFVGYENINAPRGSF